MKALGLLYNYMHRPSSALWLYLKLQNIWDYCHIDLDKADRDGGNITNSLGIGSVEVTTPIRYGLSSSTKTQKIIVRRTYLGKKCIGCVESVSSPFGDNQPGPI